MRLKHWACEWDTQRREISGTIDNQISIKPFMLRFSPSTLRWVLAASMVCFLLAWPLHQAEHAGERIGEPTSSTISFVSSLLEPTADRSASEEEKSDLCLWCLCYAGQFPALDVDTEFCVHAESGSLPTYLSPGLPPRHCLLAPDPRGPPVA